jgi:hypothetical protein
MKWESLHIRTFHGKKAISIVERREEVGMMDMTLLADARLG